MALATRCPYCHTTFRVTHDQLKLRGGLVRCGACKEIFNGVEHLLAAQEPTAPTTATPPSSPAPSSPSVPAAAGAFVPATAPIATEPVRPSPEPGAAAPPQAPTDATAAMPAEVHPEHNASETAQPALSDERDWTAQPSEASGAPDTEAPQTFAPTQFESDSPYRPDIPGPLPPTTPEQDIDPLTRMTLMDMRPWPQRETLPQAQSDGPARARAEHPAPADEIDRALGELQQKPWRGSAGYAGGQDQADEIDAIDALDNEEPDFVRQARLHAQRQRRTRLILGLASAVLAVLALLQLTLLMRTDIAARWPATRPALSSLCEITGCKLGLPQQIEYVTIESHELQALPNSENGFVLSTLLRNRSKVVQAWPHLELTLNDAAEQPVARRVLTPADYLSAQERARGMPPSSEKPVRVAFTLAQLKASGYRLYVFYP